MRFSISAGPLLSLRPPPPPLRTGDLTLLGKAMDDRLHQPYRLKLIPGGEDAFNDARRAGAEAISLSGAGPSVLAFAPMNDGVEAAQRIGEAMVNAFSPSRRPGPLPGFTSVRARLLSGLIKINIFSKTRSRYASTISSGRK